MKQIIVLSILFSIPYVCAADRDYDKDLILPLESPRQDSPRKTLFDDSIIAIAEFLIGCRPSFPGCRPTPYSLMRDGIDLRNMSIVCKKWRDALNSRRCAVFLSQQASNRTNTSLYNISQIPQYSDNIPPYVVAGLLNTQGTYNYLQEEKRVLLKPDEPMNHRHWNLARFIDALKSGDRLCLFYSDQDLSRKFMTWLEETVNQAGVTNVFGSLWTTSMVPVDENTFLYCSEKDTAIEVGTIAKIKNEESNIDDLTHSTSNSSDQIWVRNSKTIFSSRLSEGDAKRQMVLAYIKKNQNDKTALCIYKKNQKQNPFTAAPSAAAMPIADTDPGAAVIAPIEFETLQEPTLSNVLWHGNSLIIQGLDKKNMFIIKMIMAPDGSVGYDRFLAQKPVKESQDVRTMVIDEDGNIYVGNHQQSFYVTHINGWWGGYVSWFKKVFLINYFNRLFQRSQ